MVTFNLKTEWGNYPNAIITVGMYGKEMPSDPDQYGWQVLAENGEPLGTATINLWAPPRFPNPGCVFIKITPQFSGWLESLESAGLVERTGRIEGSGHVAEYAAECRVLNLDLLRV